MLSTWTNKQTKTNKNYKQEKEWIWGKNSQHLPQQLYDSGSQHYKSQIEVLEIKKKDMR